MRKHLQQHHGNQRFAFLPQWLLLLWAGTLLRRRSKGRRFCSTSSDPIMSGLPLLHLWSRSTHQRMMGKFKVLEWSVRALFFANVPIYSFSSPVTFHRCPSRGVRSAPRLWLQVLQAWPEAAIMRILSGGRKLLEARGITAFLYFLFCLVTVECHVGKRPHKSAFSTCLCVNEKLSLVYYTYSITCEARAVFSICCYTVYTWY